MTVYMYNKYIYIYTIIYIYTYILTDIYYRFYILYYIYIYYITLYIYIYPRVCVCVFIPGTSQPLRINQSEHDNKNVDIKCKDIAGG